MFKRTLFLLTLIFFLTASLVFPQVSLHAQQYDNKENPMSKTAAFASNNSDVLPPSIPKTLEAANRTYTSISLKWSSSSDNTGVRGYELYRDGKKIITTKKTVYTNTNLVPGRNYSYSVKAYDAAGNVSSASTILTVSTLKDTLPPTPPGKLYVAPLALTAVELSWEPSVDNNGVKGYEIYCNGKKVASTSATYFTYRKLSPSQTYVFTLRAYDIAGNYSNPSNNCTINTLSDTTEPSIPGDLKSSASSATEINLTWASSTDNVKVKGYEVFCDGKSIGTTSKPYMKSNKLIPGRSYSYAVRAFDESNNYSNKSPQLKVKTLDDLEPPQAPANLSASSSTKSSAALKWKACTDNVKLKGYYIYCNGLKIASTTRTTYTVKGLSKAGFVVFSVKAYDLADNVSESSNGVIVVFLK